MARDATAHGAPECPRRRAPHGLWLPNCTTGRYFAGNTCLLCSSVTTGRSRRAGLGGPARGRRRASAGARRAGARPWAAAGSVWAVHSEEVRVRTGAAEVVADLTAEVAG